jgi:hypothetical protein
VTEQRDNTAMIELLQLLSPQGERQVRQVLVRPAVYLDTWAIRNFAEHPARGQRFRAALLKASGTLALSDVNLMEFANLDDPRNTQAAGHFIDSILPHLFLMRYDPFVASARELEVMVGRADQSPAGDEKMLRLFSEVAERRGDRLTVAPWFNAVYEERERLRSHIPGIARSMYDGINRLRERIEKEPDFRRGVRTGLQTAHRPRSTVALLRAIVQGLIADKALPEDANSAIDFLHTVVPSAYCDFVLLDGQWRHRVEQAKQKLEIAGIEAKVATPFDRRGLPIFLEALEAWPTLNDST